MSFDEFYLTYRPYAERVIWAVVGRSLPDQVEDLLQNTFLRAWKAYGRINPQDANAWIACIARNVAIDSLRSLRVRQRHTYSWNEAAACQIPDPASISQAVSEKANLVHQALACMAQSDRDVLLLIGQGYKTGEIAASLGLDYNSCKQRVTRARERLRRRYLALCAEEVHQ